MLEILRAFDRDGWPKPHQRMAILRRLRGDLAGPETQMPAEAVLYLDCIARRQRARQVLGCDLDHEEAGSLCRATQPVP